MIINSTQILGLMEELIFVKVREIYIYIDNEECPSSDVGDNDCSHSEDAGVSCQGMSLDINNYSSF